MVALTAAALITWSGCEHKPRIRPKAVVVACADANFYVTGIRWSQWSATRAIGAGKAHVNDCKPNCAAGSFHTFRVTVRLSHVVACVPGHREFARIEWSGAQSGNETLPCSFLRLKP